MPTETTECIPATMNSEAENHHCDSATEASLKTATKSGPVYDLNSHEAFPSLTSVHDDEGMPV